MSYQPAFAILYYRDRQVRFSGSMSQDRPDCLGVSGEGIEGWRSTPEAKVTMAERASGNGAHDIAPDAIIYSSRTVTLHWVALGEERSQVITALSRILSAASVPVRLRVVDGGDDTYVEGYATVSVDPAWHEGRMTGTLTVVCPRPERLSWQAQEGQLIPQSGPLGGLSYGQNANGLAYPLSYGRAAGGHDLLRLSNRGTATAYPCLTVSGDWPDGVVIVCDGEQSLEWSGKVVSGVPLILDCRSQTASMGGIDVSRSLVRRAVPSVRPGGSVTLHLASVGDGSVTVELHDTYI
ncbi:hypothetical protein [Bifidobacterium bombi]|uniref:Uncharacterized protein n=1 Tax=Bifidobacterium bombi DSM 19703 TaxID=1341695 RepID=A0A080N6I2_9BIFI|nr:hypothetical protein [Bifidobacterium bombi]KFF31644.1 hypothetical protein BBOMB_1030 [Bifidobacterium bombi DSM 19703]